MLYYDMLLCAVGLFCICICSAMQENSLIVIVNIVVHVSFTCAHTHTQLFAVFQHVLFLCQIYKLIDW